MTAAFDGPMDPCTYWCAYCGQSKTYIFDSQTSQTGQWACLPCDKSGTINQTINQTFAEMVALGFSEILSAAAAPIERKWPR